VNITPRAAATVMVLRDGARGVEVVLQRRNPDMVFAPGASVFPGGAVDPADASPAVAARCHGLDDRTASAMLGLEAGGLAYWIAALRECFEEAGVLVACRREGDHPVPADLGHERLRVADGRVDFAALLEAHDLMLAAADVRYFGHWITPPGPPRRFSTRFFCVAAPVGQEPSHDDREALTTDWVRPHDALASFESGDIDLIEPTVGSLSALARFDTVGSVLAALDAANDRHPIRTVDDRHGRRVVLPHDEINTPTAVPAGEWNS